jgi:Fic family protein
LNGITKQLPDVDFFLLMYLRKDAASSSQIEGTVATMVDAILHYLHAVNYGMMRVVEDNFSLTLRFIRELHEKLMHQARVTHFSDPGEFRNSQNWIGGTRPDNARFVPPPVAEMHVALGDLEKFLHAENSIPTVIQAGHDVV